MTVPGARFRFPHRVGITSSGCSAPESGLNDSRTQPKFSKLFAGVTLACLLAAGAHGQAVQLDPGVISSTSPDVGTIRTFLDSSREAMVSGPLDDIGGLRRAMLRPLEDPDASVAFLTTYSSEVEPILGAMLGTGDPIRATNALQIAGELATDSSLEIVLDQLVSSKATDRYAAVSAMGRTFKAVRTRNTMTAGRVVSLVERLGRVWKEDPDAFVARGAVKSLRTASEVTRLAGVREAALVELAEGGAARCISIEDHSENREAVLESVLSAAAILHRVTVLDRSIPQRVLDESSVFAAHAAGQAYRAVSRAGDKASALPEGEYEIQKQLLKAADIVLDASIQWTQRVSENAFDARTDAGDQAFKANVEALADEMSRRDRGFDRAAMLGD